MIPDQRRDVDTALLAYWTARDEARLAQQARGVVDQGARAGVTSGGHLDRVAQLLARVCRTAGAPADQVYYKAPHDDPFKRPLMQQGCTLPGYYRPTKDWDLVVYANGLPIVVVELKSQNGPSYGNNANNRAEEAIGNAVDLKRARESRLVPGSPWTGYAFVIEDDLRSRATGGQRDRTFLPKDATFKSWSYAGRVKELCVRLVEDTLYDGAWPVATSRPTCPDVGKSPAAKVTCPQRKNGVRSCQHAFDWTELDPNGLGYSKFIEGMTAKIAQHYPSAPHSGSITLFE